MGMAVSPGRAAFTGDGGLEEDEARSFALAPRLNQLISASCRRLAERKHTPGGRALEGFCSSASEISDLHNLLVPKFHHSFLDCLYKKRLNVHP